MCYSRQKYYDVRTLRYVKGFYYLLTLSILVLELLLLFIVLSIIYVPSQP